MINIGFGKPKTRVMLKYHIGVDILTSIQISYGT